MCSMCNRSACPAGQFDHKRFIIIQNGIVKAKTLWPAQQANQCHPSKREIRLKRTPFLTCYTPMHLSETDTEQRTP